jgi:hypothetical protein
MYTIQAQLDTVAFHKVPQHSDVSLSLSSLLTILQYTTLLNFTGHWTLEDHQTEYENENENENEN